MNESIADLIINKIKVIGWKNNNENKKVFTMELFPFASFINIKYRYIKIKIIKNKKSYTGDICIENTKYSMLEVEEDENYDNQDDDMLQFNFKVQKPILKDCIIECINIINTVKNCESCNRIYEKDDLATNNICLQCLLEYNNQDHETEECIICMDKDSPKLYYKLYCEHIFHFNCLSKLKKFCCPMCRFPFKFKK